MITRVVFEIEGATLKEANDWGELIIDACRLDSKVGMTLTEVTVVDEEDGNGEK